DTLVLFNGSNTLTVSGVESLSGGSGNDQVTYADAITSGTIGLGGGTDVLVLSDAGNDFTVAVDVETVTGGTGADDVTLAAASNNN
ncbi:MAG TPA: hypothetical protein PLW86_04035, partial [Rhodocyclaceae bacterium]|nr:hypothetical protein [Rhodocyclaceae bacterium]